jgi:hypothetical protein
MTQYANIPGFPGYPSTAAPAFPAGPVPAGIPAPVPAGAIPAPVPAPVPAGYPAPYGAAPVAMPGPAVYPAPAAGPYPAAPVGYPAPNATPAQVVQAPLPDLNAAIAAATLGADKFTPLREIIGGGDLKIIDHQRRNGQSKKTGKYYDVLAVDFEFVKSNNPNFTAGTKCSHAFSINAVGYALEKEMGVLKTFTSALTGISLADPRIDAATAQVYRALAALDGQKPYVGMIVRSAVNVQANGKLDKTGKPYTDVKFSVAQ